MTIFTLGGFPYEAAEHPIHGIVLRLVKAGRRKSSPGQVNLFANNTPPKVGDTKVKNGRTYQFNRNSRWVRVDKEAKGRSKSAPKGKTKAPALSILGEDTLSTSKGKGRPWQAPKAPAAVGARGMAETSLRPKAKPSLPKPLTLGDDNIFEDDSAGAKTGDPPNYYLVDVADITPVQPASAFDPNKIEALAQNILKTGGLLKPVVVAETGPMSYSVLSGDLEYHAAARARQLDPRAGEMVNAFVVPPAYAKEAVAQTALHDQLSGSSDHHQDANISDPKYYLVDVADIKPTQPASAFDPDEIEALAQSILATGRLVRPLVVQEDGPMSYSVLSGDLEYHAAARAKQLNPRAGEMVAAFVAKPAPEPTIGEMLEEQKAGADGTKQEPAKAKAKKPSAKQSWQAPKAPAAVGARGMGETSLRPKAKPNLPEPLVLGDEDIFEDDSAATKAQSGIKKMRDGQLISLQSRIENTISSRNNYDIVFGVDNSDLLDWVNTELDEREQEASEVAPVKPKKKDVGAWLQSHPGYQAILSAKESGEPIDTQAYVGKATVKRVNPPSKKYPQGSVSVESVETDDRKGMKDTFSLAILADKLNPPL